MRDRGGPPSGPIGALAPALFLPKSLPGFHSLQSNRLGNPNFSTGPPTSRRPGDGVGLESDERERDESESDESESESDESERAEAAGQGSASGGGGGPGGGGRRQQSALQAVDRRRQALSRFTDLDI
ncbi:transcriptional repressor scratch 2-like [Cynara cardunculus var. scolymus]|uniref:transcriptional repressor scratch 2-like n=1 Tax=Cynara cardunculus var. scolymus TaxID=59895 RepID=UPI000D626103|nr:transcriptional repressor scratch 2-like [Cynara cardunculus var. scolymus]